MQDDEDTFFNDIWVLRFHDPYDTNWNNSSYIRISDISSIKDFWENHHYLKPLISKGMFFLMREHVYPTWDDPNNINGGCLSIKVLKEHAGDFWEDICIKLLGETLLKPEHREKWNLVNGISVSPKKSFTIAKIWLCDDTLSDKSFFDIPMKYYGDILFKKNIDNISNDNLAKMS